MNNLYHTADPARLLELKRLESDAILDVLRTINQDTLNIPQLCLIARNVMRAQLGVKRVKFIYKSRGNWIEGISLGFSPLTDEQTAELFALRKTAGLRTGAFPKLAETNAEFALPIVNRGEPVAYFLIAEFADSEVEIQNDLIFIETLGNILYVAIQNKLFVHERMQQESLRKELEMAETIQKQLLISDFSRFRDLDIYGMNVPHHGIGGDFYDVIQKGDGYTFVAIADVSGKGIGAALLMSNLQANLRALCARYDSPAAIVREINALLYQISGGDKFVTLFLAGIDTHSGSITYVNAGHCYPILTRVGKEAIQLESSCMLLGILPTLPVTDIALDFSQDDVLFMFTDGIIEQENAKGEMFGSDKLIDVLKPMSGLCAKAIVQHVQTELDTYAEGAEVADDVTMLCVKG